jgi:peptidyl-tRNA hydrolase
VIKQVILVPTYLGMSPGKVASQCCHVAVPFGGPEKVEKRVILKVGERSHIGTLVTLVDFVNKMLPEEHLLSWDPFVDSIPTTEGTDGKLTAVSITGREEDVDLVTGHLELY